ncbi:MAG: pilus assembly PilX N-terminal domain-containing protein [Patescibacteria group bacterium]|nr:pilus assembly PilX N-terminal domain-containing protein [Patescibacteria group bacterium]MDD5715595.1 pilus assembly PilX N-terminal domain-containing protein [Patescibacteria group bacterium]
MKNRTGGSIYIPVLIITTLFVSLASISTTYVLSRMRVAGHSAHAEAAFQVAEAGIEYYRWHLAHAQEDYQDGTGASGPYLHSYTDADGNAFGQFTLDITAPPAGSTVAEIRSLGSTTASTLVERAITAKLGRPSFTNFAVVANDNMRFGEGTEVFGPIHSNYGIRFDGFAHNVVSSSEITYNDPDHSGADEWAVHTHLTPVDAAPPTELASRPDVFAAGRVIDAGSVSFTGISGEFDDLQEEAESGGIYLTDSGTEGYHVKFLPGEKVGIYRVTAQKTCRKYTCFWLWCWWTNYTSTNLWSIETESTFDYHGVDSGSLSMPANGLIFIEDDVWVDGQVNGSRVSIIAAKAPYSSGNASIIINNDLTYTNYDGTDAIGLIAQDSILAGFYSEDDLRVDAAQIAQKGKVGRLYYAADSGTFDPASCNQNYVRSTYTNYGAIGTNQRYGFAYVCGGAGNPACAPCGTTASGYCIRNLYYDENFYFAPPPFFPVTDQYRVLTWEQE